MPIVSARRRFTGSSPAVHVGGGGGGGGWTPASVSTDLWYDANNAGSITASGGLVSQWNDLSGNGRHATQASSGLRFTDTAGVQNGKHGLLSVVASQTYMDIPAFTRAQPFIVVCAFKRTTGTIANEFMWEANNTGTGTRPCLITSFSSPYEQGLYDGTNTVKGGSALSDNTPYYFVGVYDGASSKFRRNGAAIATGTNSAGITNASTQQLGNYYLPVPAYLLEFFIIPGNSVTDYTNAETYLAAKWAI